MYELSIELILRKFQITWLRNSRWRSKNHEKKRNLFPVRWKNLKNKYWYINATVFTGIMCFTYFRTKFSLWEYFIQYGDQNCAEGLNLFTSSRICIFKFQFSVLWTRIFVYISFWRCTIKNIVQNLVRSMHHSIMTSKIQDGGYIFRAMGLLHYKISSSYSYKMADRTMNNSISTWK